MKNLRTIGSRVNRYVASRLKTFWLIFVCSPKEWRRPLRCEILIYDSNGSQIFTSYLRSYSVAILHRDGENVNVYCLVKAMIMWKFWRGKMYSSYAEAYVKATRPKLIITAIDNSRAFLELAKTFPSITSIFVQNGRRGPWDPFFSKQLKDHDYKVNYMLVHHLAIGKYYGQFIRGEIVPIGSFRSNAEFNFESLEDLDRKEIVFISQWSKKPKKNVPFIVAADNTEIFWNEFYSAEIKVLNFLNKWCAVKNKTLTICSRISGGDFAEQKFYEQILDECNWHFAIKHDDNGSYRLIDCAELVVHIDSTLGDEAISRGKKVVSFACRLPNRPRIRNNFGWPSDLPKNGPFWTNVQDDKQFERIIDNINDMSDETWNQVREYYLPSLMVVDRDNKQFKQLIARLLQ